MHRYHKLFLIKLKATYANLYDSVVLDAHVLDPAILGPAVLEPAVLGSAVLDPAVLPNQEIWGLSPNYRGDRWAYVHLTRESANHPINVHYKACKCTYLYISISETSRNKKIRRENVYRST